MYGFLELSHGAAPVSGTSRVRTDLAGRGEMSRRAAALEKVPGSDDRPPPRLPALPLTIYGVLSGCVIVAIVVLIGRLVDGSRLMVVGVQGIGAVLLVAVAAGLAWPVLSRVPDRYYQCGCAASADVRSAESPEHH